MTTNINNSPKYACRTCMKQQCGCKDTESALPCHFYTEQPKQEPVGYFAYDEEHNIWEELTRPDAPGATPLYAAPVRTKDLTDDEIEAAVLSVNTTMEAWITYRAVIAKFKEKNK